MVTFRPPAVIDTDQLTLRPLVASDASALFETMLGDSKQTAWLPIGRHRSVADSARYIQDKEFDWLAGTGFTWALIERASATLIGLIDLHISEPRAELGAVVSNRATARQRRAGLSALLRLVNWLLTQPRLHRVHAYCAPGSPASSTMQRLGFTLEARLANWLLLPNAADPISDALVFARCRGPLAQTEGSGECAGNDAHASRLARLGGQSLRSAAADRTSGRNGSAERKT